MKFIILCVIIGAIWALLDSYIKGAIGERRVSLILSSLPRSEYRVLNNIMLPSFKGTTQIDHIVISVYGIFVIETKNYNGWIIGGDYSEQWTQSIYGNKYKFYNPLRQNYGHIKALHSLLNIPENNFVSIVAFSPKATLKVNTNENVVYYSGIKKIIKNYNVQIISADKLDILVNTIKNANINTSENRKSHISNIKNEVRVNKQLVSEGICPRCGGELVERNGKYGKFVGCKNYPKCRYTHN